MTLTVISLAPQAAATAAAVICGVCDRLPATTLVVDSGPSIILGDASNCAEFSVCGMCAEVAMPVSLARRGG